MMASRFCCRGHRRLLAQTRRVLAEQRSQRRNLSSSRLLLSSQPLAVPEPDGTAKTYSDKIHAIVDDISQLTLLETAQLNELLKSELNIPDAPMMSAAAFAAAPASQEASADGEKEEEKTEFTVKLVKYAETSKIKLIKEIKTLVEGMNLVQAKKFVEGVPQVVQADVGKDEAERLKVALEAAGGIVDIE